MMGKTLAEKILTARSDVDACAGDIVIVRVDVVFVHDSSGPLTLRQFIETNLNAIHNPQKTI
ncbi:3-isopropylmalate dehydratase large subunit, partial [Chloroflexota bacterium]